MSADGREHFAQRAALWTWVTANGVTWHFLRFTGEQSEAMSALALMRRLETGQRRGWGALKCEARIGATRWNTMVVPGDNDSWLLPVKRAVRDAEDLAAGSETDFEVWL